MKKLEELIGMPAIAADTGSHLGFVIRVCYRAGRQKIDGFVIRKRRKRYYPLEMMLQIGNACVLMSGESRAKVPPLPRGGDCRVVNTAGEEIGRLIQPWIDEKTGRIAALEIGRGYLEDIRRGRWLVERFRMAEHSEEIIALPAAGNEKKRAGGEDDFAYEDDDRRRPVRRGGRDDDEPCADAYPGREKDDV